MATETLTTLDGFFKRRFDSEGVQRPIPEFAKMQRDIPFKHRDKLGEEYQIDVRTQRSFGWAWAGSGSAAGTAFSLATPVPGQTKPARVKSTEFVDRIQIPYGVISKAQSGEEAFGNAFDELVMTMDESAAYAKEIFMMYAGTHMGAVEVTPTDTTGDRLVDITPATFAQGLWAQSEGMPVDIYDSTLTTLRNAVSGDVSVASFDGNRTGLTLTGTEASLDAIVLTDVIVPAGAVGEWSGANSAGIKQILENTGTLFELSASTYGVWKSTRVSANSNPLSLKLINDAAAQSLGRGGLGKFRFYVSHFGWTDLNVDHSALRRTSEKDARDLVIGSEEISYLGPNGIIEIVPHAMLMAGEAWGLRMDHWERGGATDYTHRLPGVEGQEPRFFSELADKAGFELRGWWDQYGSFCKQPNKQVQIHTIVNNSLA